jgi:imidazole glycerol-phosphate synthase subunit HisF
MSGIRIIPRLDVKGKNLIKGVHLEGLRIVGDPNVYARKYYEQGADEILYIDTVASLYGRNSLADIVRNTAQEIYIPITVGGGIRSVEDVRDLLRCGADKIAVNTAAVARPQLLREISETFGAQCLVLSVQAKLKQQSYEVFTDNGRESTGLKVTEWVEQAVSLGVGEVLVTSIDKEGTGRGYDLRLMTELSHLGVPVLASGGMGKLEDALSVVTECNVDGVCVADMLHYGKTSIEQIRTFFKSHDLPVRRYHEK